MEYNNYKEKVPKDKVVEETPGRFKKKQEIGEDISIDDRRSVSSGESFPRDLSKLFSCFLD